MVEKLISLGKSPRLVLILKAVIFGLIVRWLGTPIGWWPAIFFLAVAVIFYFRPLFNITALWRSFTIFLLLAILTPRLFATFSGDPLMSPLLPPLFLWPVWAAFSMYLILGLKELIFVHRNLVHLGLFSILFYQMTFNYFAWLRGEDLFWGFVLALAASLIFSEMVLNQSRANTRQANAAGTVFGFLVFGGIMAASIMPLGFFRAANLVALGGFFTAELALHFYNGTLSRSKLYPRIFIFGLLVLTILLTSRWHL